MGLNDSHQLGTNDIVSRTPQCWSPKVSFFDSRLFYFREQGQRTGVYGVHVDDCVTGGPGPGYKEAIKRLQAAVEFRKWRLGSGDCGAQYEQNPEMFEVTMSQCFVEEV